MPQRTLVHASFGRISGFLPLSHFGTMAAAAHVIRNRVAAGRVPPGANNVLFHHVRVTLGSPVESREDLGSPRPVTCLLYLAHHLNAQVTQPSLDFFVRHRTELERIGGGNLKNDNNPRITEMRQYVADVFRNQGYDGIIYTNEVEDRGSESWVVIDGAQAVIERVEQRPITDFGQPGGA